MSNKTLSGIVISDKNDKTIIVSTQRTFKHKIYKKIIRKNKKYHVHDPKNLYTKGQDVKFILCKPISKKKKWIVCNNQ